MAMPNHMGGQNAGPRGRGGMPSSPGTAQSPLNPPGAPPRRMGRGGGAYPTPGSGSEQSPPSAFANVSPAGSQYYGMPNQLPPNPQQPQNALPPQQQQPQPQSQSQSMRSGPSQQRYPSSSNNAGYGSGGGMQQDAGYGGQSDHGMYGGDAQHHLPPSHLNSSAGQAPSQNSFYAGNQMAMQLGMQTPYSSTGAPMMQPPPHHMGMPQQPQFSNRGMMPTHFNDMNDMSGSYHQQPQQPFMHPQTSSHMSGSRSGTDDYNNMGHNSQGMQGGYGQPTQGMAATGGMTQSPTQPGHRHQPYATAKSPAARDDDSPKGTPTAPLPQGQQPHQQQRGSGPRRPPSSFPTNPPQYGAASMEQQAPHGHGQQPQQAYGNQPPSMMPPMPNQRGQHMDPNDDPRVQSHYHAMPHQMNTGMPPAHGGGGGAHPMHLNNPMQVPNAQQQQQPFLPPPGTSQHTAPPQPTQQRRGPAGRSQPTNSPGALAGAPIRSPDMPTMHHQPYMNAGAGAGAGHHGSPDLMHQSSDFSSNSQSHPPPQQQQQQQRNSLAGPRLRAPGPQTPNGSMQYGTNPPPPPPPGQPHYVGMKPGSPAEHTPTQPQSQPTWSPHHQGQYGMRGGQVQPPQQLQPQQPTTQHSMPQQTQYTLPPPSQPLHVASQQGGVMLPPPASVTVGTKSQGASNNFASSGRHDGGQQSLDGSMMSGSGAVHPPHETPTVRVGPAVEQHTSHSAPGATGAHPTHNARPSRRDNHQNDGSQAVTIGGFGSGSMLPVFPSTLNAVPVPLVIGRHSGNAVNRGGVIDATTAPPLTSALSDVGSAPLSGAASAIGCPPEFKWFSEVQTSSPTAVTFFDPVLRSQQCPRSGLLHLLFHISDRVGDRKDPARGASIITAMAQSTAYAAPPTYRRWKAVLSRDASFGLFHVVPGSQLVVSPTLAEPNSSTTSRPSIRRPILVDGDLFVSNVLRALTDDDPHWHLVSTAPQMVVDLCAEAAEKLFVDNDWEPKFIFSGVQNKDCELDSVNTTTNVMQQQDRVWAALKYSLLSDVKRYVKNFGRDSSTPLAATLSQHLSDDDGGELGGSLDPDPTARATVPAANADDVRSTVSNEAATDNTENSALRVGFSHEVELHPPYSDELRDVCATHLRVSMNFEVIRSPQFSWAQAATLLAIARSSGDKNPLAVYGPPEALLFDGIDTVVLGMLSDGHCVVVHKKEVLAALYAPGDTEKAKLSFSEIAALVPETDEGDVPAPLSPELCDALASRLTQSELQLAWVDLGLLTSTHSQLGGFRIRWPSESPYAQGGREVLQAFRYRTLHPVRNVPPEIGSDDEAMVADWRRKHPQESGLARYRLWPFLHYGLDVTSHRSVHPTNPDTTFLSYARKAKWRVLRGRAALKHGPVAAPGVVPPSPDDTEVALVAPLSRVLAAVDGRESSPAAVHIPKDLHSVTGNRLPQMLYYAHLIGVVRSTTLTLAAHGVLKNERPVADSFLLRKCVKGSSLALCCLIFEELLRTIDPDPPQHDTPVRQGLMWSQWFFPTRLMRQRLSLSKVDEWPLDEFPELAKGTTADDFPIDLHSALHLTRRGIIEEELQVSYETRRQFVAAVHLKLLDFLGYLVHPESQGCDCELSYFGKALADFPRLFNIPLDKLGQPTPLNDPVLRQMTPHYAQQVLLLIELVRTESLTGQILVTVTGQNWDGSRKLPTAASGVVMAGETEPNTTLHTRPERQAVLLASRIACLCPMIIHGPWRGLIDRDLTSFACIAQKMQGLLRLVADVYAATTLVSGKYSGTLDELVEVGAELPMGTPQSAAGGCAMRFILDTPDDIGCGLQTPEERLSFLAATFPCLLPSDVRREAAKHGHQHRHHPFARHENDHEGTPDPLGVSTASQHSSCCPPGCPDDDNIDVHHISVLRYMSGIVDEIFAFWDVCMSTLLHLRDLVVKNENETGSAPSPLHVQLDALCETLRQANEIVVRKKSLFVSSRAVPSESDQSVLDDAMQESSVSHADA